MEVLIEKRGDKVSIQAVNIADTETKKQVADLLRNAANALEAKKPKEEHKNELIY